MTMLANDVMSRPTAQLGDTAATGARSAINPRMRETAQEFEAVFLAQVLQTMNAGIGGPGPFSEGDNEAWSGMLQEEYGRLISRSGGIGVADSLLREMLKMQESG